MYEDTIEKMTKTSVVTADVNKKEVDHIVTEYDSVINTMKLDHDSNIKKMVAMYESQIRMLNDNNSTLVEEVGSLKVVYSLNTTNTNDIINKILIQY